MNRAFLIPKKSPKRSLITSSKKWESLLNRCLPTMAVTMITVHFANTLKSVYKQNLQIYILKASTQCEVSQWLPNSHMCLTFVKYTPLQMKINYTKFITESSSATLSWQLVSTLSFLDYKLVNFTWQGSFDSQIHVPRLTVSKVLDELYFGEDTGYEQKPCETVVLAETLSIHSILYILFFSQNMQFS